LFIKIENSLVFVFLRCDEAVSHLQLSNEILPTKLGMLVKKGGISIALPDVKNP